jgi:D-3-phosphoglycerate dehydrogenase / 2-oxoglutarate reductase
VMGYDPEITIDAAWSLPAQVKKATSVAEVLKGSDIVTLHVPLVDATRNLVNEKNFTLLKPGAVLLNFGTSAIFRRRASSRIRVSSRCLTLVRRRARRKRTAP